VALLGCTVALVLAVLMVVGLVQVTQVSAQVRKAEQDIVALELEHEKLEEIYRSGYDLEQIREEALAMGMIPKEQAETITVQIRLPEPVPAEPSVFEQVWTFLTSLFA
jgi:hypothetical protein